MARLRRVDAAVMSAPRPRANAGRTVSPEQQRLINKIKTITDETVVYEVTLEGNEKPLTVRQQLLRAAKAAGVPIAVRKSDDGFYIGLLTPARRSTRGRKPKPS